MLLELAITILSVHLKHEGGDGADRAEREAMHRSHSQLPYFLGRPTQEHTVIKSGYCVKQGAVVRTCHSLYFLLGCVCVTLWPSGTVQKLGMWRLRASLATHFSDKSAAFSKPHNGHATPFMISGTVTNYLTYTKKYSISYGRECKV